MGNLFQSLRTVGAPREASVPKCGMGPWNHKLYVLYALCIMLYIMCYINGIIIIILFIIIFIISWKVQA